MENTNEVKNTETLTLAVVKIRCGMAVSDFLFDTNEEASAFFLAASNIHNMGQGRDKCAMWPIGTSITEPWKF